MTLSTLAARFQHIIDHYDGGNLSAFARRVGLSQSTLYRNLKGGDERLLLGLVGWVLLGLPSLSRRWLLYNEGEMLLPQHTKAGTGTDGEAGTETGTGQNTAQNIAQAPLTAHAPPAAELDAYHANNYASMIQDLRYIIESQKHTLEIQARMLEMHRADPFKKAPALGSTAAALSAPHHNE